jgi:methylenetetrahydrofolate dehydrogenase (NADP+) / methenyltetrahydrofolate cyclohydrolase
MSEIDGKQIAHKILDQAKRRAERLQVKPTLAVIMVGNNLASAKYVARKAQAAEYVGIDFYLHRFPENATTAQLVEEVLRLQMRNDAVVVQLPLPKHVEAQQVLDAIKPEKDADCLSSSALGRVVRGNALILPPTASSIVEILKTKKVLLKGKHVVVVGQGELVGKPVASMLLNEAVTLTVCGLGTKNLIDYTKQADILVLGAGKPGLIKAAMVKKGVVVIDAGTTMIKGKLVGDVDFNTVSKKAKYITPTPGGVGPITVAKLLDNVVTLAEH